MILGFVASITMSSGRCSIFELLVAGDPGMEDDVDIANSVANKLSALLQIVRLCACHNMLFQMCSNVLFCNAGKIDKGTRLTNKCFRFTLAILSLACLMYFIYTPAYDD